MKYSLPRLEFSKSAWLPAVTKATAAPGFSVRRALVTCGFSSSGTVVAPRLKRATDVNGGAPNEATPPLSWMNATLGNRGTSVRFDPSLVGVYGIGVFRMLPDVGETVPVRTKLTGRDNTVVSDVVRVCPPNRSPNMFGLNVAAAWVPASGARGTGSAPGAGGTAIGGSVVLGGGRVGSNGRPGSHGGTGPGGQFGGTTTGGHTRPVAGVTSCATPAPASPSAAAKAHSNRLIAASLPVTAVRTGSSS